MSQRPKRTMRAARTDGTTLMRSALAALRLSHPTQDSAHLLRCMTD